MYLIIAIYNTHYIYSTVLYSCRYIYIYINKSAWFYIYYHLLSRFIMSHHLHGLRLEPYLGDMAIGQAENITV